MEVARFLRDLCPAITRGFLLAIVLPLIPVFLFGFPLSSGLALITGTFIIEYGAAALGIGLGLHPIYVLYVLVCVAFGVTLTMFDIFDILGENSTRVSRFLEKIRRKGTSFRNPDKIRDTWPDSLRYHVRILCLPGTIPDTRVATGSLDSPDHGGIYIHLDRNVACDDRYFQAGLVI